VPRRQEKDSLPLELARLRGIYSDQLIDLVIWCMQVDPLARPQSVFALLKELNREVARGFGLPAQAGASTAPSPSEASSSFLDL
jgi:hypothetical protein